MTSAWIEAEAAPRRSGESMRVLGQAMSLALLTRPKGPAAPLGGAAYAVVAALYLLLGAVLDDLLIEAPRWRNEWAFLDRSFPLLIALGISALAAAILGRPRIWLRLATVGLLALFPAMLLWRFIAEALPDGAIWQRLPLVYCTALLVQMARWAGRGSGPSTRPWLAAGAAALIVLPTILALPYSPYWWTEDADEDAVVEPPAPDFSAEELWLAQPERLARAVARLTPQQPNRVDLYTIGVAGDADENVFRNEVRYLEALTRQRLAEPGRMLSLVNHPETRDELPLATFSNLRAALKAVGERMDREQDILLLFLTSHGSPNHEFYLGFDPLPLDPIRPEALRAALDEAGIRWRVLVISACYSGGFIDALASPETLVLTAARRDRPSFGCGSASDITWFGQALLVEGLNHSTDFFEAFRQARASIRQREREAGERPSYPQISRGSAIGAQLERWRKAIAPGPVVPFFVADAVDRRDKSTAQPAVNAAAPAAAQDRD